MTEYASAPVMVWELAGRPHRATLGVTDTPGVCAMCARQVSRSAPAKKWLEGKSFTDPAHLRARSDRVCEGCVWACTGKGMDQIRMWTILARTDLVLPPSNPKAVFAAAHLHFTSRADMRAVAQTLSDPPSGQWMVAVAESGQKHVLPYAQINYGACRWQVRMDAQTVDATPDQFRTAFAHTAALRQAGHTAGEIEHLKPHFSRLKTRDALTLWTHHADHLAPWRSAPLLHLTNFMISKEFLDEYLTDYPAPGPDARPDSAGRPGSPVPRHDAHLGGRGDDRPHVLVGPGPDRPRDRDGNGDTLF